MQTRSIKRRIKSVTNTRKITKAMELVAASKMRKAVSAVLGTRPYSKLAWETVLSIGEKIDTSLHPLLRHSAITKKVLLLVMSSDRGLAGGYNSNLLKAVMKEVKELGSEVEIQTICVGKRGADAMRRAKLPILASFTGITNNTKFEEALPIGRLVISEFVSGGYDKVLLAYTDFISAINQKPLVLELLPLGKPLLTLANTDVAGGSDESVLKSTIEHTFEPDPRAVLDRMLPRLIETMVYQAVLESAASEHSARMMAMRSASDNAA
ncbi:MAG: ATP synthase F1 subunit gamma, partial [Patescibacteria group bacterium]